MRTIAVVNHKGGCAKTVTAINLAACMAERTNKVLLVDLDPQGHASLGFNVKPEELEKNMYHVLSESHWDTGMKDVIIGVDKYLDLAPSGILLSAVEQELAGQPGREDRLLNALAELSDFYDYIIIDCPPSLGLLTFNALRASRELIVPVEASFFALHGLGKLSETIKLIEDRFGQKKHLHALATLYDRRTRIAGEVFGELRKYFGKNLFKTIIHINVRLKEATGFGQPICQYDRRSSGYRDYTALAKEVHSLSKTRAYAERPEPATITPLGPQTVKNGIKFSIKATGAKNVQVAGDFNNWNPKKGVLLDTEGQGIWSKVLPLEPGTYQYRFVVDGQWLEDPQNPDKLESPFGGMNSVIKYRKRKETGRGEKSQKIG
jgi:chromosome partitioning protein